MKERTFRFFAVNGRRGMFASLVAGLVVALLLFQVVLPILAAPPTSPYRPGEILNPTCAPTDPNCTVTPPLIGAGTSTQLAFWDSSSSVASDPALTYTSSTGIFAVNATSSFLGGGFAVGTSTVSSLFAVATTTPVLSVFSDGAIGFRNVSYLFPGAQGGGSTVLTNDGTGNLSWSLTSATESGWRRNGTVVSLATSTDFVGIGTATPTTPLDVALTATSTSAGLVRAANSVLSVSSTEASAASYAAGFFLADYATPYSLTNTTFGLSGVVGTGRLLTGGTGTVAKLTGVMGRIDLGGAATTTDAAALRVFAPYVFQGRATQYAGLNIEASGISGGYGIFQAGSADRNYFAGTTGIGTSNPSSTLHVVGTARVNGTSTLFGNVGIGTSTPATILTISTGTPIITLNNTVGGGVRYQIRNGSFGTGGFDIFDATNNVNQFAIDGAGRISMGSSSIPAESKLFIYGGPSGANVDIRAADTLQTATVEMQASDYAESFQSTFLQYVDSGVGGTTLGGAVPLADLAQLAFQGAANALIYTTGQAPIVFGTNFAERMRLTGSGRLGIGTSTPSALFTVGTSTDILAVASSGLIGLRGVDYSFPTAQGGASTVLTNDGAGILSWGSIATSPESGWRRNGTVVSLATSSDMVGIGTSTPTATLHVVGTSTIIQNSASFVGDVFAVKNTAGVAKFSVAPDSAAGITVGQQLNLLSNTLVWNGWQSITGTGASNGGLTFSTAASQERMRIDSSGRVGIGTSTPSALFTVGTSTDILAVASSGLIGLRGVDYSFPTSQGGASTVLTNDGAGILSWASSAAITSINGSTSSTQTFATSSDTNLHLRIATENGVHTFTPVWVGTLADSRITSAATWNAKITTTSLSVAYGPLAYDNTTGVFSLPTSTLTQSGFLSSADWSLFNGKGAPLWTRTSSNVYLTTSTDSVGIGTASPSSTLHVVGTSQFTATSTFLGNVGIGTQSPGARLHVDGGVIADSLALSSSSIATLTASIGHQGYVNFSGGIGTGNGGTPMVRLTQSGNLVNIGSIKAGEALFTRGGTFATTTAYGVGTQPRGVAIGDMNGDAKMDAVVSNFGSDSVSILFGNGDGTFTTGATSTVGGGPRIVNLADFNGDGKLDIAVVNSSTSNVSVVMNTGNGTFAAAVNYAANANPCCPTGSAVGDVNGDGRPDIVVSDNGTQVTVLTNNGDGTFAPYVSYGAGGVGSLDVALGDLNGDAKLDIAVTNFSSSNVAILLNNGNGTFAAAATTTASTNPYPIAIADVNGDGIQDLAVGNYSTDNISILIGAGNGTFAAAVNYAVGDIPQGIALTDVNGDGKPDIVNTNNNEHTISTLINNGDGTFAPRTFYSVLAAGNFPLDVATGDLNGDGKPDIVTANSGTSNISVLLNTPETLFFAQASTGNVGIGTQSPGARLHVSGGVIADSLTFSSSSAAILTANTGHQGYVNFSGGIGTGGVDSSPPALRLTSSGNLVNIGRVQAGEALFTKGNSFATVVNYVTGGFPTDAVFADVTGDGRPDIISSNNTPGTISVFPGAGDGTFGASSTYTGGGGPLGIIAGDVSGDGKPDIVVANTNFPDVGLSVLVNSGTGTFGSRTNYPLARYPVKLALGDLNGDGTLDIAATDYGGGSGDSILTLMNEGDGTFGTSTSYAAGAGGTRGIALGDLNGDGKLDIAATNYPSSTVGVYLNTGAGLFSAATYYTVGTFPAGVAIGDLNGDNKADLVVSNSNTDNLSVLINAGSGAFGAATNYTIGDAPRDVTLGDMNGDGALDVVVANSASFTLGVLLNNGDGTLAAQTSYATSATGPHGVSVADVNGDGKPDMLAANQGSDAVSVFVATTQTLLYAQASSGNVGIGTSAPSSTLYVSAATSTTFSLANTITGGRRYDFRAGGAASGTLDIFDFASSTSRFAIDKDGRVGINASAPSASAFQVNTPTTADASTTAMIAVTDLNSKGLVIQGRVSQVSNLQEWQSRAGVIFNAVGPFGDFGIGTSTPAAKLHVVGTSRFSATSTLESDVAIGSTIFDPNARVTVLGSGSTTLPSSASTVMVLGSFTGTTLSSSIRARGTVSGGLSDIGEYASVEGDVASYEAGDLLSIAPSAEAYRKTDRPYDPFLAGVVTRTAGIIAGGGDSAVTYGADGSPTNRIIIALAGRVPMKVSTENGPIRNGDPLTASSQPGIAMRATAPGQIVGFALENFPRDGASSSSLPLTDQSIVVMVNPGFSLGALDEQGEIIGATPELGGNVGTAFVSAVRFALTKLGVTLRDGVATLTEVFADRVTAKRLCLDDLCIGKDELQTLLDHAAIVPSTPPVPAPAVETPPSPTSTDVAAPASTSSASSTDVVVPPPAEEPVVEEPPLSEPLPPAEDPAATESPVAPPAEEPVVIEPPTEEPVVIEPPAEAPVPPVVSEVEPPVAE